METIAEVNGLLGKTLRLVKEDDKLFLYDGETRCEVHLPVGTVLDLVGKPTFNDSFSVRSAHGEESRAFPMKKVSITPQAPFYDLKQLTGLDIVEDERRGITRSNGGVGWTRSKN